jgi:hypothetical protein
MGLNLLKTLARSLMPILTIRHWILPFVFLGLVAPPVLAGDLEDLREAVERDEDLLEIGATAIGQTTVREGESSGSYEIDLIGSYTLLERDPGQPVGDGRLSFWAFTVNSIGDSAEKMQNESGLPWSTSDVTVEDSSTNVGVLVWQQQLLSEQLMITAGKLFMGNFVLSSDYYAANTTGFMNRAMSNDRAGRYFDILGLGMQARWQQERWYASVGFADAKAEDEFDFDSLSDGELVWTGEVGMATGWGDQRSELAVMVASFDQTDEFRDEDSVSLAFQHDLGEEAEHALYGRYTWRNGGKVRPGNNPQNELPTKQGGFFGWRWNRAFSQPNQQFAVAGFYGEMNDTQRATGFDRHQYGAETYWRIDFTDWASVTFDLQVMQNIEDDWEAIPGVRLKLTGVF